MVSYIIISYWTIGFNFLLCEAVELSDPGLASFCMGPLWVFLPKSKSIATLLVGNPFDHALIVEEGPVR